MQRIVWLIQIVVVGGLILGGFDHWARRQPDPVKRAVLLRRAGFGLMALSTLFFGAFVIGDTFADPRRLEGSRAGGSVGSPAGWPVGAVVVPPRLGGLRLRCLVGGSDRCERLVRPEPASVAVLRGPARPIRAVLTFVLVAAIAVFGLKRTPAARVLLLAVGLIPVAVSSLGSSLGFASLWAVSAAPVIAGVLYLVSAHVAG